MTPAAVYTELGLPARYRLNNGGNDTYLSWYYENSTQRLTETKVELYGTASAVADTHYTYDPAGNVNSIGETIAGDTQCFTHDYLRRISEAWTAIDNCTAEPSTSVIGGFVPYWQSYTYDVTGNRTGLTEHNTAVGGDTTQTYTHARSSF